MTDHIVTALRKEKERLLQGMLGYGWQWYPIEHALLTATWCQLMHMDHWEELHEIVKNKNMQDYLNWIDEILPKYTEYHEYLGKPEDCDAWIKAVEEKWEVSAYEADKMYMRILFPPTEVIKTVNDDKHKSVDNTKTS